MTLHLSAVVPGSSRYMGDACTIRQFRHTDFSRCISPVVLVDHFVMTGPTFDPHTHAGISAATLMLEDSTGVMQSLDGIENNQDIHAGDLHWTQAGRGIVHAQRPVGEARLHGLQIFIDHPAHLKSLPPMTSMLRAADMPAIQAPSGKVRVVSGSFGGLESPLRTPEPLLILDGSLRPGATTLVPMPPGWNAWFYAIQGDLGVRARHCSKGATPLPKVAGGDPDFAIVPAGSAAVAGATRGGEEGVLLLMAGKKPVHFVLVAGSAVGEVPQQGGAALPDADGALAEALAAYGETEPADALTTC
ncbi:pirin family protein [Achromobacter mucicolens]|uniref:pirin family protein n=1 Tax=Achromobacter mucicolens TaxID=1389922 RepID=UPI00244B8806|nr:pirin family protein [Achromobacter mucicolens]MDH1524658.1 pirin family protein [Achromobacter mucicolens]